MRAVFTQVRAAVLRRRAQTAVVLLVSLLASGVATMALTLLVRSTGPWDDVFRQSSGAHLIFHLDASKVSPEQLQATASLPGVTAAGPVQPTALVPFEFRGGVRELTLIGRDSPGGALDRIPVVAGRWPSRPGEIVVTRTEDITVAKGQALGETIHALTTRGMVDFKVVGQAIELGGHGSTFDLSNVAVPAWVVPSQIAALVDGGQIRMGYEMAYRFQHGDSPQELAADRQEVEGFLPAEAQTEQAREWTQSREGSIWFIAVLSSIIVSFTVFALVAATVIVASVVAGSVVSSYRDIGIAKSVGFTPRQVLTVYVAQMAVPALAGAVLGLPVGTLASRPFLDEVAFELSLPAPLAVDPTIDILVPAGLVLLVVLAATPAALRAAATDSIRAMALGSAPSATRRSHLAAALARLGAPRPISIGAGDAFARPARAYLTIVALGVGIATATIAIGFQEAIINVLTENPAAYGYGQDVVVQRYPGLSDSGATQLLAAQPETGLVVPSRQFAAHVPGPPDTFPVYATRGDLRALGYSAVEGRWFAAPGEAVIGGAVARIAHVGVGDSLTVNLVGGGILHLRVVGKVNDFGTLGKTIRVDWATASAAVPDASPDQYLVKLRRGADPGVYAQRVSAASPHFLGVKVTSFDSVDAYSNGFTWMVTALALILMAIAAAGVFNAARLTTRERVRDIAILKTVGMTGRQIAMMLVASTLVLAAAATVLGVPLGTWLEGGVIWSSIADTFGVIMPVTSYSLAAAPLALIAALVVAMAGAALPARWAAATPVSEVLRSE